MVDNELTRNIIKAYYGVYNTLGYGFLEKVYENAMLLELQKKGIICKSQVPIKVYYDKKIVGEYYADLIIDNVIIIELKATAALCAEHEAQLLNYLKATEIEVGFLFNFGKRPQFKRKVWTNNYDRTLIKRIPGINHDYKK